jgi:hypothetical protein
MGMKDHANAICDGKLDVEASKKAVGIMRKGWNIVEKNQERISTLVMDMLTFSKEREPVAEAANLNELTADVVELMKGRAGEEQVELVWLPAPTMPTLMFDPEAMHRAVLNIMTNAIDACHEREGGRVEVSTQYSHEERMARVQVVDNGSGIPKEDLEKIFAVFVSRKGGRGKSTADEFASRARSITAAVLPWSFPPRRQTPAPASRSTRRTSARTSKIFRPTDHRCPALFNQHGRTTLFRRNLACMAGPFWSGASHCSRCPFPASTAGSVLHV